MDFLRDTESSGNICPTCRKGLNNSIPVTVIKGCGHAVCQPCCDEFVRPQRKCSVCDHPCKSKDVILLEDLGTGHIEKGKVEVKRFELAFV